MLTIMLTQIFSRKIRLKILYNNKKGLCLFMGEMICRKESQKILY